MKNNKSLFKYIKNGNVIMIVPWRVIKCSEKQKQLKMLSQLCMKAVFGPNNPEAIDTGV